MSDAVSENNPTKATLLSGFRQFLIRGNVVDLAIAVVVGAAFSSIVNSVVKGVINPVVGAFGTQDLANYKSCLTCTMSGGKVTHGVYILWGSVLSSALNFLITAAVVYFLMVAPMARFLARRAAKQKQAAEEQTAAEAEDIVLLREIRDALVHQRSAAAPLIDQRGPGDGH